MKLETKVQAPALRRGPERIHLIASLAGKPSRYRSQTTLSIDAENFSAEIDFYPSYELVKERLRRVACVGNLCGAGRDRTDDIQLAKLALSQLSYSP